MSIIYLACPYTSHREVIRNTCVELASIIAAELMEQGRVVFSPITHGHGLAQHLHYRNASSHEFWMKQCLPMVKLSSALLVVPLEGWRESRGVSEEIAFAQANNIPILIYQSPNPLFEILDDEEFYRCNYLAFPASVELSHV